MRAPEEWAAARYHTSCSICELPQEIQDHIHRAWDLGWRCKKLSYWLRDECPDHYRTRSQLEHHFVSKKCREKS